MNSTHDDDIDWANMHNKIIPKEKLISLEQFYNLTLIEKNPSESFDDENQKNRETEFTIQNDKNLDVLSSLNNDQFFKSSNLRVDHFKFIKNSKLKNHKNRKDLNQVQSSLTQSSQNQSLKSSFSFNNRDDKKYFFQNNNLNFLTPKYQMTETKQKRQNILKNKVFTIQTETLNEEDSKNLKQSNTKLTYLKRYVANFSKNGQQPQFSDGYWGNNPGNNETPKPKIQSTTPGSNNPNSVLSVSQDKQTPTNMFGNYIPFNPNQASFNPSLKERELSIIDLQLPIKSHQNQSFNASFKQKKLVSQNYFSQSTEFNNEHLLNSDETTSNLSRIKNFSFKHPISNSSTHIDQVDYTSLITRANQESSQNEVLNNNEGVTHGCASGAGGGGGIPDIDDLIKFKSIDRSNSFLSKYLMNQQKKKLNALSNSNNKLYETTTITNLSKLSNFKSQNVISNPIASVIGKSSSTEILVNSSLNNLSSNSLLIKRLKF